MLKLHKVIVTKSSFHATRHLSILYFRNPLFYLDSFKKGAYDLSSLMGDVISLLISGCNSKLMLTFSSS